MCINANDVLLNCKVFDHKLKKYQNPNRQNRLISFEASVLYRIKFAEHPREKNILTYVLHENAICNHEDAAIIILEIKIINRKK